MLAVTLTGWYAGFVIGAVTIVVVVVLVAVILRLARNIGVQALEIGGMLEDSRANTEILSAIPDVNRRVGNVVTHAAAARGVLEGL